jgi:ubiquinone/menaquinone biosynthesis C-methylase UbiE
MPGVASAFHAIMPAMRADEVQTNKLLKEYTALAPVYDQRWSAYLNASLHMTLEKVAELPAERVLDVACGTGLFLEILAQRSDTSELVGVDRVPAMLDVARQKLGQRVTLLESGEAHLPFADAAFSLVTSSNALHYFPDVDAALLEIRRVISPHGNLVITDWCRNYVWMKVLNRLLPWTQHAHVHTYKVNELERSLLQAGFSIESATHRKIDWFWGLMTVHATPSSE